MVLVSHRMLSAVHALAGKMQSHAGTASIISKSSSTQGAFDPSAAYEFGGRRSCLTDEAATCSLVERLTASCRWRSSGRPRKRTCPTPMTAKAVGADVVSRSRSIAPRGGEPHPIKTPAESAGTGSRSHRRPPAGSWRRPPCGRKSRPGSRWLHRSRAFPGRCPPR